MRVPQLPVDKANHLIDGAVVFVIVAAALVQFGFPVYARPVAFGAVVLCGLGKELSDWLLNRRAKAQGLLPPHGVESADALATMAGGLLCWVAAVATGDSA